MLIFRLSIVSNRVNAVPIGFYFSIQKPSFSILQIRSFKKVAAIIELLRIQLCNLINHIAIFPPEIV
nr:MAG TPA: hypothetical protein [Bacteriophage sp.]